MVNYIFINDELLINANEITAVEKMGKGILISAKNGEPFVVKDVDIRELYEIMKIRYNNEIKPEKLSNVIDTIEEVKTEMCNDFCRYPREWDEEKEGMELVESTHCQNCPLNRL